jgi:2-phosphosulfolactate phosphatase
VPGPPAAAAGAPDWFAQTGYRCRLEWGAPGARQGAARGDVLVVVDTLRFSTATATAVHCGAAIYPCRPDEDGAALAARVGAWLAGRGAAGTGTGTNGAGGATSDAGAGGYSLSPLSYVGVAPGTRVVLPSPNGATCARHAADVPYLFAGAPVNAGAVAAAVARILDASALGVTVIACGERPLPLAPDAPGGEPPVLRFAVEDALGAGAILAGLAARGYGRTLSPEARVCAGAFRNSRTQLGTMLWDCGSGRELRAKGLGEDVRHAARLDLYADVPVLRDGAFVRLTA